MAGLLTFALAFERVDDVAVRLVGKWTTAETPVGRCDGAAAVLFSLTLYLFILNKSIRTRDEERKAVQS